MKRVLVMGAFAAVVLGLPPDVSGQPACGAATPADGEGPFYKAGALARASLVEPGSTATILVLTGVTYSAHCKPLAGVVLDFWQADERGAYDNTGFRYRGVVKSDAQGRYRLETILPPPYQGRPRHIHVKVQRPGGRPLTTQLYFPGESRNADPALLVKMGPRDGSLNAMFDFVL